MNSQINHIIHAALLLLAAGAAFALLSNIPYAMLVIEKKPEAVCGNVTMENKLSETAQKGKALFNSKCASCHNLYKDGTGPKLAGFEERGVWSDRKKLHEWIKNPSEFMKQDAYARSLKENFGSMMTGFPGITAEEVNAIATYIITGTKGNRY